MTAKPPFRSAARRTVRGRLVTDYHHAGYFPGAQRNGARIVACSMSMEAMGIRKEELIDGVEIGGVADFLAATSTTSANLFI